MEHVGLVWWGPGLIRRSQFESDRTCQDGATVVVAVTDLTSLPSPKSGA